MATFFGTTNTATFFGTTGTGSATWYGTQVVDGPATSGGASGVLNYVVLEPLTDADAIISWVNAVDNQDSNFDDVFNEGVLVTRDTPITVPVGANDPVLFDQIQIFQTPVNGRATALATRISYAPDANFIGRDAVGYTLFRQGRLVGSGYLFIGVIPAADVPTDSGGGSGTGGVAIGSLGFDRIDFELDEKGCAKAEKLFAAVQALVQTHNAIDNIAAGRVNLK